MHIGSIETPPQATISDVEPSARITWTRTIGPPPVVCRMTVPSGMTCGVGSGTISIRTTAARSTPARSAAASTMSSQRAAEKTSSQGCGVGAGANGANTPQPTVDSSATTSRIDRFTMPAG